MTWCILRYRRLSSVLVGVQGSSSPCPCCGSVHEIDILQGLGSDFKQFYKLTSPIKRGSSADLSNSHWTLYRVMLTYKQKHPMCLAWRMLAFGVNINYIWVKFLCDLWTKCSVKKKKIRFILLAIVLATFFAAVSCRLSNLGVWGLAAVAVSYYY